MKKGTGGTLFRPSDHWINAVILIIIIKILMCQSIILNIP